MQRRDFLHHSGIALGLGALTTSCQRVQSDKARAPLAQTQSAPATATLAVANRAGKSLRDADWQQIKGEFRLDPQRIHMASFLLASHPHRVRAAIEGYREALDLDPEHAVHQNFLQAEIRCRQAAGTYLNVDPACVALTDSTTMGMGLLYSGLILHPGDEILVAARQHYVTEETLRLSALQNGAQVRKFEIFREAAHASIAEMVDNITRAIQPQTRVLALTWVDSLTGVRLPAREVAKVVQAVNQQRSERERIIFILDAVHGFGVEGATVDELGCDFLAAGCHKWLLGPRGTGILYGRREYWSRVRASIAAFDRHPFGNWLGTGPAEEVEFGEAMSPGGFHSFEHRWALDQAFGFHFDLGKERIRDRIHVLNTRLKQGIAEMKHIKLHTPLDPQVSAGIVAFNVAGLSDDEVVKRLAAAKIAASVTPSAITKVRLAPSLVTLEHEVDACIKALAGLRAA